MSSTNRGGKRCEADFYPTPYYSVESLLSAVPLLDYGRKWIEPAAGTGAIITTVDEYYFRQGFSPEIRPEWTACELRPECQLSLNAVSQDVLCPRDFVLDGGPLGQEFDVSITNPPFSLACEMVEQSRQIATVTVMLLRLNFLGSMKRQLWLQRDMPSVYVLSKRPSFVGGATDSCEYAWFVWGMNGGNRESTLRVI